jgi:hypothetical protein
MVVNILVDARMLREIEQLRRAACYYSFSRFRNAPSANTKVSRPDCTQLMDAARVISQS